MAIQKEITVTISPMADVNIEAAGFTGKSCDEATAALEKAVSGGGGVTTKEYKPEYRKTDTAAKARQTTRMG